MLGRGTASSDNISKKSVKFCKSRVTFILIYVQWLPHSKTAAFFFQCFGTIWRSESRTPSHRCCPETLRSWNQPLVEDLTLFLLHCCLVRVKTIPHSLPKCAAHIYRRFHEASRSLCWLCRAAGSRDARLPSRQSTRVCFKNHKWALNCFHLPARARTERGKNNQHQFCQPSSLCLLGCSQLTQIQLLSKLNERPHNCLDDTFSARCSLLLHPWDVPKDRTASVGSALRGDKHKHKNKNQQKYLSKTLRWKGIIKWILFEFIHV